ncbi:hypothetical protein AOCH_000823 [Aspergillus ochraceoroseus]|uniref:Carrier domain-containing protein n=1 Tax=Aspergillus ochraceoroseus TaxID=138278 RepID=A0A0F8WSF3_9EURO|nr:hypothetical protein AOCH_000823 [Aspergillus ochraceoroseus]
MDRLRQITRMANATLIVCSQSAAERMKNLSETVVVAETISEQPDVSMPSSRSSAATDSSSGPDDTAYVLFTSGSTGEPKGVVMSHGSLCTGIVEQGRALGCSSKWRSLQFSAHTFDPSISEGLMTLCHGGCVCVPSEEARLNDLPGVIRELDVNCAQLTPSVAHVISPEEVPSLKTLIFVGEAANSDNVARWAGKLQLINAYGPTETCIYCSVKDDFTTNTSPTSVGKACGGNNWIVEADNHEQLAAVGCVGEVVVSGPSLGKGYLDNEIATSAAFVTCSWLKGMQPFAASSNRLYRTGDLAFYNVDGSMQLVGRKDNQVKVRGNRVELGEVERRLNRLSSITTIMACVPKAGPLQRQLITVFSLSENDLSNRKEITLRLSDDFSSPGTKSFLKQLRERLSREVPGYMIPSYWVVVEEIPLNNSGKLDRKAVRQWIEAIDESQAALITQDILSESDTTDDIPEQHTDIYEILRKVWGEVLDFEVDRITPHTSFFTLNGNSLSAIKVVALSKKHGLNFTVQDLLLGRTLARLCEVVEVLDNSASSATEFSLAPSQEYLLSLYDDSTANIPEHRSSLLQTLVELPHTAIQRAFVKLIQVHPMLRARFLTVDGTWKYRLADSQGSYRLLFTQSRAINEEEQDAIVRTAHSSIDIKTGPIFSGDVFRTEAGSFMYIVAHRLAVDEHSWNAIRAHLQRFLITKEDISVGSTFQQWKQKISDFVPKLPAQLELQAERLEYWGLTPTERPLRQDTKHHFAMDISSLSPSSDALEYPLIQAMQDKVSAALLYSFHQVFVEYQTPLVHIEKDGRYLVQNSTEFLDTVGPFSIIHTVPTASMDSSQQQVSAEHILSTIKNSPQMFSNATGAHTKHPDIFIRYRPSRTGGQDDSFFYEIDNFAQNWMYSSGSGLVDIDIELSGSLLSFDLYFHSTIKAQDLIFNWASKTREILERAKDDRSLKCLDISAPVFPLLSLDSESMKKLTLEILPQLPGGTDNVEDIYPCSSMQLHILQYQSHNSRLFSLELTFEIGSNTASPIDPERLAEAWERIVNRHSILRTVFVQPGANNTPVQVVLRTIANTVSIRDPLDPVEESPSTIPHGRLPRLTIFALPSGAVSCELQISHALTDGWTNSLFQRELVQEYLNFDHHGPVTPYRSFIARSVATDKETDVAFWVERLKDCSPCSIKCLTPGPVFDPSSPASVCALDLPSTLLDDFSSFCNYNGVTTTTVIDLAWALTLEVLTNNSEVLYGHIVSGQARSLPELYTTAGPTLNMLATRINLSQNTLPEMAHALQAFKLEALNHDSCSPSELEQVLGTTHLYNTAVNISLDHQPLPDSELYLRHISLEDPWDLDIVLRAWTVKETIYFRVEYKPSEFSFHEIGRISDCFWAHLCLFARQQLNSQTFYQRIATRVALLAQGR